MILKEIFDKNGVDVQVEFLDVFDEDYSGHKTSDFNPADDKLVPFLIPFVCYCIVVIP